MVRSVVRTNAVNASIGMGSGASFGPVTPPCAWKPWQAQQPCWTYAALPFSADAANAAPQPNTRPAASAASPLTRTKRMDRSSLPRLRPDIDERWLTDLHRGDRLLDGGPELGGILDRPLRPPAHRFRKLVILDVGVLDAGADRTHVAAQAGHAVAEVGQALDVHDLLVIAAVVVHHRKQRDLVLRGGPQHARCVHEVAVGLDADGEAAEVAIGERGTHRRRRAVTDAVAAGRAEPMVMLLHRP